MKHKNSFTASLQSLFNTFFKLFSSRQPVRSNFNFAKQSFFFVCHFINDFLNRVDEGLILFIEDTDESMSKVDRMLHQLEIRGILSKLNGIIVGHFSKYKYPESGFADMYEMLHEYLQHYNIPICYDFPVGHHSGLNYPMVEGSRVKLIVGKKGTSIISQ